MTALPTKPIILISGLFVCGYLFGQLWSYLGDNQSFVNRYLEVHNSRILNSGSASKGYYVFYNDLISLTDFIGSHTDYTDMEKSSMDKLALVNVDNNSLPSSLNYLRKQEFVSFVFPGTFPFICH